MLPSKIMMDCLGQRETSRFFPSIRMDGDTSNAYISPFQTPITNRYSSSTDNSTSPESYFNTPFQITPRLEHSTPRLDTQTYQRRLYDTVPYVSAIHIIETPISNPAQLNYGPYGRHSFEQNFDSNVPNIFDKTLPAFERQYNETQQSFESNFSECSNTFYKNMIAFEQENNNNGRTSLESKYPNAEQQKQYNERRPSFESNFSEGSKTFDRNMIAFGQQNHNNGCKSFEINYPSADMQTYDQVQIGDTPLHFKRARAIVGRKVLDYTDTSLNETIKSESDEFNIWQPHSSKEATGMQYELFPSTSNTKNEFETPKKPTNIPTTSKLSPFASPFMSRTPPDPIQYYGNPSPTPSRIHLSPININRFQNLLPDNLNRKLPLNIPPSPNRLPYPDFKPPYNPSLYAGSSSSHDEIRSNKICTFCRKNGETPSIYLNHCVKEKRGNRYIVSCPILRDLVCSTCGATGDEAHTITYCPVLTITNKGKPLPSTTVTLKSTRIKSNGRKRY